MTLTHKMRESEQRQGLLNLCSLVKSYLGPELNIVEIGSYCGASSEIIASTFPKSIINCVDPWEKYIEEGSTYDLDNQELELKEAEGIFNSIQVEYPNIKKNKMSSLEYAKFVEDKSLDFIYIDGNHQYSSVKEDIQVWYNKIKPGGIISGHDFNWIPVSKAVIEFFNEQPSHVFIDSSWFYFKK
jgi:predicted O-methyltransferase YrrM